MFRQVSVVPSVVSWPLAGPRSGRPWRRILRVLSCSPGEYLHLAQLYSHRNLDIGPQFAMKNVENNSTWLNAMGLYPVVGT